MALPQQQGKTLVDVRKIFSGTAWQDVSERDIFFDWQNKPSEHNNSTHSNDFAGTAMAIKAASKTVCMLRFSTDYLVSDELQFVWTDWILMK